MLCGVVVADTEKMQLYCVKVASYNHYITKRDTILLIFVTGLFKSQKRAQQEANCEQGLSIKQTHLLGDIADAEQIEHG